MRKFVIAILSATVCLTAAPAFAGNKSKSTAIAVSQNENANFNANSVRVTNQKQAASAVAPGLTSGGISCAKSGGMALGTTAFSFSAGGTTKDVECDLRQWIPIANSVFGAGSAARLACKSEYFKDEPRCQRAVQQQKRQTVRNRRASVNTVSNDGPPTFAEWMANR